MGYKRSVLSLVIAGLASNAFAQDYVIEEVVVTAQKRAESAQDVPVAISAFNEEMLFNTGVNDINAVLPMIPGLSGTTIGIATNAWGIRGISTNDWTTGSEPSVAVFFDDAYIGRNVLGTGAFFDIQRLEVVKGPQGTLFGRNASVGAISIVSNKPGDENAFSIGLSGGNEGQREYNAVANIAVSDQFALRAAVHGKRLEGIWRDVGVNEDAFTDDDSIRLMARYTPSDAVEALLTLSYSEAESNMGGSYNVGLSTVAPGDEHPDTVATTLGAGEDSETDGINLRITWDLNDTLTLTSITDRRSYEYFYRQDLDGTNDDATVNAIVDMLGGGDGTGGTGGMTLEFQSADVEQDSISQEFRLNGSTDSIDWFVGASYFQEDVSEATIINLFDTALGLGLLGRDFTPTSGDNESVGVYGDARIALNDQLSLTLGVRWSQDDKSWCTTGNAGVGLAAVNTGGVARCGSADWSEVTSRAVLDYQVNDDVMLFLNIAQGYKGGGFNASAADNDGDGIAETAAPFDPETNLAYELGMKSTFADGRVRLNASAFFNDYEDLQIQTATLAGILISNAAEAETKGFEVELTAMPTANLTLMANYAFLDAEFTAGALQGNTLAYAPENSYSIGFTWDVPLEAGTIQLFTLYNWQDDMFFDAANTPAHEEDAYGRLNARLSFTPSSDNWDVAIAVDNALDEEYTNIRQDIGLGLAVNRGLPRLWRAEINYRF
jgi:iron complex outermembrane receptor protein